MNFFYITFGHNFLHFTFVLLRQINNPKQITQNKKRNKDNNNHRKVRPNILIECKKHNRNRSIEKEKAISLDIIIYVLHMINYCSKLLQ